MMKVLKPNIFEESAIQCALKVYNEAVSVKGDDLEYEIRKALLETKKPKGVYFLISEEGKLLYVGKSENLLDRLVSHVVGKGGNSARYFKLVKEVRFVLFDDLTVKILNELERTFIRTLKPAFNGGNFTNGLTAQYGYESLYPQMLKNKSYDELGIILADWPTMEAI